MKLDLALLSREYKSIEDVVRDLTVIEETLRTARDRRAVFVTAYVLISRDIRRRLASKAFQDGGWVERYAVAFANLYRRALFTFERGDLATVPKSWRISFRASSQGRALVLQDLVLGINAHVNHDLPVALREVTIDPDRATRHADHTAINEALEKTTRPVRDRIEKIYAPGLAIFDKLLGPLEEEITSFSFEAAREHAWAEGVALVDAGSDEARRSRERIIDNQAQMLGQVILAPTTANPLLVEVFRHIEKNTTWWDVLGLHQFA
ncbi:MAG: hypothetical protein HY049_08340 [Acidobacteria bacterium]|nr:hypothetical protein [Acidobacteriota bacterium]